MKGCLLAILASGVLLAAESDQGSQDAAKLNGTWSVTSAVRNRNELPADRLKGLQLVLPDGSSRVEQGEKTLAKGTFRIDAEKMPREIDLTANEADGQGQTTLVIYELADDTLRICGARPGAARPGEFAATDGNGCTLTVFRRLKP